MSTKRTYADGCAAAHALDLVGERWALLVVRELVLGPKRFTDLRAGLPGISPNILTQRLLELERVGVVARRKLPPPASAWVYEATDWGRDLEPILQQLGRWGARSPLLPRDAGLSVDSFVLSLRTMFDPALAHGIDATIAIELGDQSFVAKLGGQQFSIERGEIDEADLVVRTDPMSLAQLVYDRGDVNAAVREGRLELDGDKALFKRFLKLFPLPEPADVDVQVD